MYMHLLNLVLARPIYFRIVLNIITIIKVYEFVIPSFFRLGNRLGRVIVDYVKNMWVQSRLVKGRLVVLAVRKDIALL
jgi:hypothetical protein